MSETPLSPLLSVIFDALIARGWTLRSGNEYVSPEGVTYRTLEDAISAQTFIEIRAAR